MLRAIRHLGLRQLLALFRSSQRSVALPLTGMALGLIFAGVAMLRRAPSGYTTVPPGYVALVDQQGILMNDFISQTATETQEPFDKTTREQRTHVLREMINRELEVQRALVLDLPETTTEVRQAMAHAVENQATAGVLATKPTTGQLRAYYDAHRARYSTPGFMTVRNLVLHVGGYQNIDQTFAQAESDAIEAVYEFRSGTPLNYIIEHFGFVDADPLYHKPQLDFAAKIHLGALLYNVARTLSSGQVSDPVVAPDGVHVLVMLARTPPETQSFAVALPAVYNDYRLRQQQQAVTQNLRFLRSQAQILLAPGMSE